jgi:hypothetical protein
MPDNKEQSPEEFYRDLIVEELRELVRAQKDTNKELVEVQKDTNDSITEILDRLKTIEIVVVGVNGVNKKTCLMSRVETLEDHTDALRTFKTKVIAIVAVIQAVGTMIIAAAFKLLK